MLSEKNPSAQERTADISKTAVQVANFFGYTWIWLSFGLGSELIFNHFLPGNFQWGGPVVIHHAVLWPAFGLTAVAAYAFGRASKS